MPASGSTPPAPGPRWSGPGAAPATLSALLLLAAACGGRGEPPSPPVPPEVLGRPCPLPQVYAPGEPRPRSLRVHNATDWPLTLWLDRCFRHTRMADLPPGESRAARLPDHLVAYDGHLLVHAFDAEEELYRGTWAVDARGGPVVELRLEEGRGISRDSAFANRLALREGTARGLDEGPVADEEGGWLAVWGIGGGGALSWTCRDDDGPFVSVALGRTTGRERLEVEVAVDEGGWEEVGPGEVVASITDAVVLDEDRSRDLTERLRGSHRLRVRVGGPGRGRSTVFAFPVDGVPERVAALRCGAGPGPAPD